MNKIKVYLKSVLIPVIIGGIVGIIISSSIDYSNLRKPMLAPPSILFPIVWTILYILMGISYGILRNNGEVDKKIKIIYYAQLLVNALWRLFAFIWILVLILLIAMMIIEFYKKNKLSALLQIPYLLWTVFAAYLNLSIYILNK